jgi:hypothetical protein
LPEEPPGRYPDVREWYAFEYEIWNIGEQISRLLSENKNYKLNEAQAKYIVEIATNPCAKGGRQSFVMLLGYKKYQCYADEIASQIEDPNISGHVIDTLLKMRVPGYAGIIKPFTTSKLTWIKNTAKKYIERYSGE